MFSMNRLSIERRAQILGATTRMASCSFNTVSKLLLDVGGACSEYQDRTLQELGCELIPSR